MNHTLCKQAKQKTGAAWIWDEHKQWKPGNSIHEEFATRVRSLEWLDMYYCYLVEQKWLSNLISSMVWWPDVQLRLKVCMTCAMTSCWGHWLSDSQWHFLYFCLAENKYGTKVKQFWAMTHAPHEWDCSITK